MGAVPVKTLSLLFEHQPVVVETRLIATLADAVMLVIALPSISIRRQAVVMLSMPPFVVVKLPWMKLFSIRWSLPPTKRMAAAVPAFAEPWKWFRSLRPV